MSDINRYTLDYEDVQPDPNGNWVTIFDHERAIRATRNDTIGEAIAAVAPFEAEVLRIAAVLARNVGLQDGDSDEVSAAMTRRAIELKAALDRHRTTLTALRTPTEDAEALAVADSAGA